MYILHRILLWLAVHLQMTVVVDWTPEPHVHLFKTWEAAVDYAWNPPRPGTEIVEAAVYEQGIAMLRKELERE
jgi:hypothetical protein